MNPVATRRNEPPDAWNDPDGVWVHRRVGGVEVRYFVKNYRGVSEDSAGYTPAHYHRAGDIWEGPFPVPSLPSEEPTRDE